MRLVIILFTILAVFTDRHIYRTLIKPRTRSRLLRWGYILFAALTDASVLGGWIIFRFVDMQTRSVHLMLWITFIFLVTVLPRMVFCAFAAFDTICRRGECRPTRLFRWIGFAAALLLAAVTVWGTVVGRQKVVTRHVVLHYPALPDAFDGLRIVQFSDVHIGSLINAPKALERLVEGINALDADLVVNTGDLVNIRYEELSPEVLAILGRIRAREGVWSVLGNHDLGFYIRDTLDLPTRFNLERVVGLQRGMGWNVLVDSTAYLLRGNDTIALTGINFPEKFRLHGHNASLAGGNLSAAYAQVPQGVFNIALSHAPQMWREIMEQGRGDLTLSGHVHSMQFKIRLFGRQFSPAQYLYKEWSGLYEQKGRYLYINDGYGYVGYPMRLGAYPEITLIELRK